MLNYRLFFEKVISQMASTDELMELIRAALLKRQSGVKEQDEVMNLPV